MKGVFAIALLLSAAAIAHAQGGDEVRIYRCTDGTGKSSLRDTPCPKGQQQQTRDMLRPKDAPIATRPAVAPAPAPVPQAAPAQVVYLAPPQPMYECVTDEGRRYTSENGEGNPRWVPFWTQDYWDYGMHPRPDAGRGSFRPAPTMSASIGKPQQSLPRPPGSASHPHPVPWPVASGGGSWVRDTCTLLPPRETCARLRERRDRIRTRFFNAMPSEREVLRVEERTINARLDDDCRR